MKVIVSDPISEQGIRILKDNNIKVINANGHNVDENFKHIRTADGWIIRSGTNLDAKIIEKSVNLSVIGRAGVGVDNIDISAATRRGIVVMNTPDANTISAAEHTMALILALSRNVSSGHNGLSKGEWNRHLLIGSELHGKTIGIVGLGKIGREVMQRSKAFNMKIIYHNRKQITKGQERKLGVKYATFDKLITQSDIISIHVPHTKETNGMFNMKIFKKMKNDAFLINTSRGKVVNEKDLTLALKQKTIAGAGLDVFEIEPIRKNHPFIKLENIVLAPHVGSSTKETRGKMAEITVKNLILGINGKKPIYSIGYW